MADIQNFFTATAEDLVFEAIALTHCVKLDRTALSVTIDPVNGVMSKVTLTPKSVNGMRQYDAPVSFNVTKLDLAWRLPKDMVYSGYAPITYASLHSFLLTSYGFRIEENQWEIEFTSGSNVKSVVHEGMEYSNLTSGQVFILRALPTHPFLLAGTELPLTVTSVITGAAPMMARMNQFIIAPAGEEIEVPIDVSGGVTPYSVSISTGNSPLQPASGRTALQGRPNALGNFNFTVAVKDALGQQEFLPVEMEVILMKLSVTGSFEILPRQQRANALPFTYNLSGGIGPYKLIRTEGLPLDVVMDDNGTLTGDLDVGVFEYTATFQDSQMRRVMLSDILSITPWADTPAEASLLPAMTDWVELGGGRGEAAMSSQFTGGRWSTSSDWNSTAVLGLLGNGMGYTSAAVKFKTGSLTRETVYTRLPKTLLFILKTGYLSSGSVLWSNSDGHNGLDVFIHDQQDNRLRLVYYVDGVSYSLETPEGVVAIGEDYSVLSISICYGWMRVYVGTTCIAAVPAPDMTTQSTLPARIGRPARNDDRQQYTGTIVRHIAFKERMYADQLRLFVARGSMLTYNWLRPWSQASHDMLSLQDRSSSELSTSTFNIMIPMDGVTLIAPPLCFEGSLPPGLEYRVDGDTHWITGQSTQFGIYKSRWAYQTPYESGTMEVVIEVGNPADYPETVD